MTKKQRLRKEKEEKKKNKIERGYTETERNRLYTGLMLQMAELKITEALSDETTANVKKIFNEYVTTGKEQEHDIDIPLLGRTMIIRLYNNAGKKSYVNLRRNEEVFENREELSRPQIEKINDFNKSIDKLEKEGANFSQPLQKL